MTSGRAVLGACPGPDEAAFDLQWRRRHQPAKWDAGSTLRSMSLRSCWVEMNGWLSVRNRDTIADAKQGTMIPVSPERFARISVVDKGVRVIAVSMPAWPATCDAARMLRMQCACASS